MIKPVFNLKQVIATLAICLSLQGCQQTQPITEQATPNQQPNVLLIMIDDYRAAMGAMGDQRAITPNLDKLASQGVLFNRAYANVPVCGASRASMMTSVYPTKTRFVNYLAEAEKEVPEAVTLGEFFKQAGYITISNGKVFHNHKDSNAKSWTEPAWYPKAKGSAFFNDESKKWQNKTSTSSSRGPWYEAANQPDEAYYDGQVKQKTLSDLARLSKQSKPFFLATGFRRPHLPFNAPQKYFDLYKETDFQPSPLRTPPVNAPKLLKGSGEIHKYSFKEYQYNSDKFHRLSLLGYYAAVSFIDQQVGDILASLDEHGLRENTIVVLTSDHGFNLGEHNFWGKHNMLNTALQVPLIISTPKHNSAQTTDALVSLVDVFPTLVDLSGLTADNKLTQQMVGQSLTPLLTNPNAAHKPYIYSRFKKGDSVVSGKLIYTQYQTDDDTQQHMLFDLDIDPNETTNVVSKPQYQADVKRLANYLQQVITQSEAYLPKE